MAVGRVVRFGTLILEFREREGEVRLSGIAPMAFVCRHGLRHDATIDTGWTPNLKLLNDKAIANKLLKASTADWLDPCDDDVEPTEEES
jgi:hypothetical protein